MSGSDASASTPRSLSGSRWAALGLVFFLSGAVSLVYQVLWLKQLSLLFGNTVQAAAATLTAFFLGLALGGWGGGRLAPRLRRPLRAYGTVELAITVSALFYFLLLSLYRGMFPDLYRALHGTPALLLTAKFVLSILVLLPASTFMGATLPVLGQYLIRGRERVGRGGTALYGVNTLGAAIGAYLAGFHLPLLLGFRDTYLLAVGTNALLGIGVLVASSRERAGETIVPPGEIGTTEAPVLPWSRIRILAFATGFITLALEVLWVHMFTQVLHNSVYTFSAILITFLLALAAGSGLAHLLARRAAPASGAVVALLALGGLLVGATPRIFSLLTHGLSYIGEGKGWGGYQLDVFSLAAAVIFLPTLLLGTVFPYLMKLSEGQSRSAGRTLGRLVAVNTVGAILGSLAGAFVFLAWFGLWGGILLAALLALLAGMAVPGRPGVPREIPLIGAGLLLVTLLNPVRLPLLAVGEGEQVLQTWQSSSAIVAVVEQEGNLLIKVDNHYSLGGSASLQHESRQGSFPLLLHPYPRDVFYLGLGTGITAGAAMPDPVVERVTVCEILPDAITAAERYFGPYTRGLFEDPRTRMLAEDGRTFLAATGDTFNVVVADLFVPWKAGIGSLYTREHYEAALAHLGEHGLYAQWLPLFQLSRREVEIIARTMVDVFPLVTMWRGDLFDRRSIAVLIGHAEDRPLVPDWVRRRLEEVPDPNLLLGRAGEPASTSFSTLLLGYCGNLTAARSLLDGVPLNTDDRPLIEYRAPVTQRDVQAHRTRWMEGEELMGFYEDLQKAVPAEKDPYLSNLDPVLFGYERAGLLAHTARVYRAEGREEDADAVRQELQTLLAGILSRMGAEADTTR